MSRIIPQMNKTNNKLPKWLDEKAIVKAGKEELAQKKELIQKVSSREATTVIASYICQKCSKVLKADHKDILAQANMNTRAGAPEKAPVCMTCGDELQPFDTIAKIDNEPSVRYADQTEKRVDLVKEASDHGTTNSFVDRHLQFRAVDTLSTFARKSGMLVGRARYLRSARAQQAGQEYSTLNNFECEIEWMVTPKLKRRVTATISYDPEGKFIMPKVFKTAEGKEYPFEKKVIQKLTTDVDFKNTSEPTMKKTDQMQFRKPDPSNFKAVASLNETTVDNESIVERLTSESKKKVPEVDLAKNAELGETYQAPQPATFTPPGASTSPNQPAQFQPNTKVVNNLDGKVYNVVSNDPTKGVTVTDPTTNQQSVVPAQDAATNLKPALKTSAVDMPPPQPQQQAQVQQAPISQPLSYNFGNGISASVDTASNTITVTIPEGAGGLQGAMDKAGMAARFAYAKYTNSGTDAVMKGLARLSAKRADGKPVQASGNGNLLVTFQMPAKTSSLGSSDVSTSDGIAEQLTVKALRKTSTPLELHRSYKGMKGRDWDRTFGEDSEGRGWKSDTFKGGESAVCDYCQSEIRPGDKHWVNQDHPVIKACDRCTSIDQVPFMGQETRDWKSKQEPINPHVHEHESDSLNSDLPIESKLQVEPLIAGLTSEAIRTVHCIGCGKEVPVQPNGRLKPHLQSANVMCPRGGYPESSNYNELDENDNPIFPPRKANADKTAMNDVDRITKEKSEDDDNIAEKVTESYQKKYPPSTLRKIAMLHESRKNWQELRKEIQIGKPKQKVDPDSDFSRQTIAAKAMGFDPYKGKADKTGRDSKTLLPMGETKDIEIGMTEFPKDQDHDTHLNKGPIDEKNGYNIPFKEMNENQVKEREHFHNEDKLPIHNMRREDLADYVKGKEDKEKNYGLNDDEERALRDTIGMKESPSPFVKRGADEPKIPKELPITYNPNAKKAPASDAYKEPDVIPELSGDAQVAMEELQKLSAELTSLKEELARLKKPYEEGIQNLNKTMDPKMAEVAEKARTYMEIAFNEIATTKEGVFHFKDKLVTAYPEETAVGTPATAPQIIEAAKGISAELAEAIQKLRAIVENKNTSMVIRRFLTEFPISKGHEKKLGAIDETGEDLIDEPSALQQFVDSLREFIISLKQSNLKLLQA